MKFFKEKVGQGADEFNYIYRMEEDSSTDPDFWNGKEWVPSPAGSRVELLVNVNGGIREISEDEARELGALI